MRKIKRILFSLLMVVALSTIIVAPASAADPTVTITFAAEVVAATNTQATWAAGALEVDDIVYFSADNNQDDNYSQLENTGNVAIDVELQGQDAEGGDYDLTLAASAGSEQFSIYANSSNGTSTYDIEVKSSSYTDLVTNLAAGSTYVWSLKMTMPTAFNGSDDGSTKQSVLTLAVTKHT